MKIVVRFKFFSELPSSFAFRNTKSNKTMKTRRLTTVKSIQWMRVATLCVAGMFAFTACDDDEDKFAAPEAVQAAFSQQYSGATRVEWEYERSGYIVAEFWKDNKEHDAWYTPDGSWMMTENDHGRIIDALPQAGRDVFYASAYAQWVVDDIDEIQRPDYEAIFKIEVEQRGQQDHDLYFDTNGTLFRDVTDQDDDRNESLLPSQKPSAIEDFINGRYAGARIVDIFRVLCCYVLEVIYFVMSIELRFDSSYSWLWSKADCGRDIPAVVTNALSGKYAGYRIDDCDWVETASGESYYLVDLDNYEMDVRITEDGQTSEVRD